MKSSDAAGATGRLIPWPHMASAREFLPAALEVIETPASPLGRGIAGTIMLFFTLALAWAWFGRLDIVATAGGRIVPAGQVKLVQPLQSGVVRAIHVQDGDRVQAGQVLIELDPTTSAADRDKIARDLLSARLDVARLSALKQAAATGRAPDGFVPPETAPAHDVDMAVLAMQQEAAEQTAKLAGLDRQIDEKRAEAEVVAAMIDKLKTTIPVLEQKENLRKQLFDMQYGNRFAYLDAEQALLEARHDMIANVQRAAQTAAARAALERRRDQDQAEYARRILSDLAKAEKEVAEQTQELIKAERKSTEATLTAPIDGVVQQLAIHTVGGVVTPAQQLMVVVPEDRSLLVEAMVPNRDVGFVHPGQAVEVKIEAFAFTRYGLISGRVIGLSRDAVTPDRRKPDRPGEEGPVETEPEGNGSLAYVAQVALDRSSLLVDGVEQPLRPGMAVTAEIKTGSRRILSYLLSPLQHYARDAATER